MLKWYLEAFKLEIVVGKHQIRGCMHEKMKYLRRKSYVAII